MSGDPQEIFCDESGFTGNNLLSKHQPFFVYASVAIDCNEAIRLVTDVKRDYGIQGDELKGARLVKFNKGRKAISEILSECSDGIKVITFHKEYTLACKFFEWVIEPTIAAGNSLFYQIGFHEFIGNLLYLHFRARQIYSEDLFEEFERLMREKNDEGLTLLFGRLELPSMSPILKDIRQFCICHKDTIRDELQSLVGTGVGKWLLDVTDTALFSLLAEWGQAFSQLCVYCDESQPLAEFREMFKVMVNRKEKKYVYRNGEKIPITFNLSGEPNLVRSDEYPGIQIADVAAAATVYVLTQRDDKYAQEWKEILGNGLSARSCMPILDKVDLDTFEAKRNALVLTELVDRSLHKVPLLEGIREFIEATTRFLIEQNPPKGLIQDPSRQTF